MSGRSLDKPLDLDADYRWELVIINCKGSGFLLGNPVFIYLVRMTHKVPGESLTRSKAKKLRHLFPAGFKITKVKKCFAVLVQRFPLASLISDDRC